MTSSPNLLFHIKNLIHQNGPLPFATFMQEVLYAPDLGYYVTGHAKLGQGGDFVTAPEISPLFSYCIARQCQEILMELNGGEVLEFGAGSGKMALDILRFLEREHTLPLHYYILEISPDLTARQQQLFQQHAPHLLSRVQWLNTLPENFIGVMLANEVLDAMPVHRFKKIPHGFQEIFVDYQHNQFLEVVGEPTPILAKALQTLSLTFSHDYESEINLWIQPWLNSVKHSLKKGVVLLIDYGFPRHEYYHPERHQGTLMCHYQHRAHSDPYRHMGFQDITAHVDFTAVAEAALQSGLQLAHYTHQAAFLCNLGITDMIDTTDETQRFSHIQHIKQLTLPHEMGELFKVIALTQAYLKPLKGFQLLDHVERLMPLSS